MDSDESKVYFFFMVKFQKDIMVLFYMFGFILYFKEVRNLGISEKVIFGFGGVFGWFFSISLFLFCFIIVEI